MAISREVIAVFTRTGIALVNMVFGVLGPGHKAKLDPPFVPNNSLFQGCSGFDL